MATRILHYISIPMLLLLGAVATFLAIHFQWHFELAALSIFLFTAVYILILEKIIPLKPEWKTSRKETVPDIKHLLSTATFDALGKTVALSAVLYVQRWYFPNDNLWGEMPFILAFVLANLIGEFLPYLYHRISHKGKISSMASLFLWKVHSIHHLPQSMNWFKTNWMHPLNMFLNTFLKYGPLLLMGFSKEVIFAVGVTHVVIAYLSHANIQAKTGVLDYVVVTPQIHHFHHSTKMDEAKNFGNILPFWDLIFGTYFNRKGTVHKVGVYQASYAYPNHQTFLKQMAFPFYAYKTCCLTENEE